MRAIFEKEFKSYFYSMNGYVYLAFSVVATAIYFVGNCVLSGSTNFAAYVLGYNTLVLLISIPILTMKLMAEEKRQKTDQLLFTAPVHTWEIVVGKYLAALAMYGLSLAIIMIFPCIIAVFGDINVLLTINTLIGAFCLGAGMIAIGLFISCITEHQMIAAIFSFVIFFLMFMLNYITDMFPGDAIFTVAFLSVAALLIGFIFYRETKDKKISIGIFVVLEAVIVGLYLWKAELFDNGFANMISWISLSDRYQNFISGVFQLSSVIYYISFVVIALGLAIQLIEHRRWK